MQLGDQQVEFTRFARPGRPYPADSQSADLWFQHFAIVVSDMDAAYARVRAAGMQPISLNGPETLPERNGGVRASSFAIPTVTRWSCCGSRPDRGGPSGTGARGCSSASTIAPTVSSTEKSLAFYQGHLGLHTVYAGTNEGETQERLDGAAGAVVRITGLQAAAPQGPGIEFLQYEKPATGRPAAGIRADDAAHAHLTLVVDSLQGILAAPEAQHLSAAPYT